MFHGTGTKEKVSKETLEMEQTNARIEEERKVFSQKNPDFDMKAELQNPQFVEYVWGKGLSVEDAYLLCHKEELLEHKTQETIPEKKQERVMENGAEKSRPAIARKNPKDLSDKEIDAIIDRVKKGETITF